MKTSIKHKTSSLVILTFLTTLMSISCASKKQLVKRSTAIGADSLADLVIKKTNGGCWDSVRIISWTFLNHKQVWDKSRSLYILEGKNEKTIIDLNNPSYGIAYKKTQLLSGADKTKQLTKAYDTWANDSFWLNPFWKFYDNTVSRRIYIDKKQRQHLVVYYKTGEDIGDLYDWTIGNDNLPSKWNLFVKIIPFNNLGISWSDWKKFDCGLQISQKHKIAFFNLGISNLEIINEWERSTYKTDPFTELVSID